MKPNECKNEGRVWDVDGVSLLYLNSFIDVPPHPSKWFSFQENILWKNIKQRDIELSWTWSRVFFSVQSIKAFGAGAGIERKGGVKTGVLLVSSIQA